MDKWRYHPGVLELAAIARSERLGRVHGLSTTRVGWGHPARRRRQRLGPRAHTTLRSRSRSSAGCHSRSAQSASPRGAASCTSRRHSTQATRGTRSSSRRAPPSTAASVDAALRRRHCVARRAVGTRTSRFVRAGARVERRRAGRDARRAAPAWPSSGCSSSTSAAGLRRSRAPWRGRRSSPRSSSFETSSCALTDATILVPYLSARRAAAVRGARARSPRRERRSRCSSSATASRTTPAPRVEPFLADPRVRFFDLPKGERHGERNRHLALAEAAGRIVCYLSDDDLLLPRHVATMLELLEGADFAHGAPFMRRAR